MKEYNYLYIHEDGLMELGSEPTAEDESALREGILEIIDLKYSMYMTLNEIGHIDWKPIIPRA